MLDQEDRSDNANEGKKRDEELEQQEDILIVSND